MSDPSFFEQKPRSPAGLAIVIALHAAAIAALALAKMEMPVAEILGPLKIRQIEADPEPPPLPPEPARDQPRQKSVIDHVRPEVPTDRPSDSIVTAPMPTPTPLPNPIPDGIVIEPAPQPLPRPEPVRIEARIDPRSVLQPDYPASEQRLGNEGLVTVRVLIGTDGRVKSVEKVRAANDALYRATERHALRSWRFRPATVDGRPVESRKQMTVTFRITD